MLEVLFAEQADVGPDRKKQLGDDRRDSVEMARPNFAFPGAWMYSEGKAVVHLVDISKTDEAQKPDSGVVHHVAFASTGFDGMKQRLQSKGMAFDSRQVPGGDLWQIFVDDPNGVMIELNYEAAKEGGTSAPVETREDMGAR